MRGLSERMWRRLRREQLRYYYYRLDPASRSLLLSEARLMAQYRQRHWVFLLTGHGYHLIE